MKRRRTEFGIYKRKPESKKERKHAFDREKRPRKKERKNDNGQEKRKKTRSRPRK